MDIEWKRGRGAEKGKWVRCLNSARRDDPIGSHAPLVPNQREVQIERAKCRFSFWRPRTECWRPQATHYARSNNPLTPNRERASLFFHQFPLRAHTKATLSERDIASVCLLSANYSSIDLNYENQLQVNLPARSLRPEPPRARMHKYTHKISPPPQPQESESEKRPNSIYQGCFLSQVEKKAGKIFLILVRWKNKSLRWSLCVWSRMQIMINCCVNWSGFWIARGSGLPWLQVQFKR